MDKKENPYRKFFLHLLIIAWGHSKQIWGALDDVQKMPLKNQLKVVQELLQQSTTDE